MNSKTLPLWLGLFCGLYLVVSTFLYFPLMGHDYSLAIPALIDMRVAWTKFGVFNPEFSAQKCLGLPVWSSPSSISLSVIHFLLLVLDDLSALSVFIFLIGYFSFYGCYLLSKRLLVSEGWSNYLALGWTLQGWMVIRTQVGHISYISFGLLPLIVFLALKKDSLRQEFGSILLLAFLLAQYVFFPAPYIPFFFLGTGITLVPLYFIWKNEFKIKFPLKLLVIKGASVAALTILILSPKLLAVADAVKNFPRQAELLDVGFWSALPYSILNLFSFLPHNFQEIVGWPYGNWESIEFIFPAFLVFTIYRLLTLGRGDLIKKNVLSLFYILLISVVFSSGILSKVFSSLPVLKSMHVNPRWNIIIVFLIYSLAVVLCRFFARDKKMMIALSVLAVIAPVLHFDKENLAITYPYSQGYDEKSNRMGYCYEPWLGYRLEYFPLNGAKSVDWMNDPLRDPRCYLASQNCKPGSVLNLEDAEKLRSFQLKTR